MDGLTALTSRDEASGKAKQGHGNCNEVVTLCDTAATMEQLEDQTGAGQAETGEKPRGDLLADSGCDKDDTAGGRELKARLLYTGSVVSTLEEIEERQGRRQTEAHGTEESRAEQREKRELQS